MTAEKRYSKLIEEIDNRSQELKKKKAETQELLAESGDLYRELFGLYMRIRKTLEPLKWELNEPPKPPDPWIFILDDAEVAQAFGKKPFCW